MTTVTAVICAYWPDRFPSIQEIVVDLQNGTVVPENIIVINNNPEHTLKIDGAKVINSERNFTSRSKYPVALLEPSDYYVLLDDDISVQRRYLEACLSYAYPGCCFSDWGIQMTSNFISNGNQITAPSIDSPVSVDAFFGIMQFLSFEAIVKMLEAESKIRIPNLPEFRSVGEDLLVAMANDAKVIPLSHDDEANLISKPIGSDSMQYDLYYGTVRDIFAYQSWIALGNPPFPGKVPSDDGTSLKYVDYLKNSRESE